MTVDELESAVTAAVLALADPRGSDDTSPAGRVAGLACGLLGVPAAGVLLAESDTDTGAALVAATSMDPALRDVLMAGTESGPGPECVRSGRTVSSDDLVHERHRWLRFAARAASVGVRSVTALPLRRRDDIAGALIMLHHAPGPAAADLHRHGQLLADAAAIGILHEWEVRHAERVAEQLRGALRTRIVIEQAKGALAVHAGIDPEAAFGALRGHARRGGRGLNDVAADVVAGRVHPSSIVGGA